MVEVVTSWGDEVAGPALLGAIAVLTAAASGRRLPAGRAAALGLATAAFVVGVRRHLPPAIEAVGDRPAWFGAVAIGAGVVVGGAAWRALATGRDGEVVATAGVMAGAAAAALPDVEVLLGLSALWLPWTLLALRHPADDVRRPAEPGRATAAVAPAVAAVLAGAAVAFALVDGARGRPGAVLIAPAVVAPVALVLARPPARSALSMLWRLVTAGVAGLLVARHGGLTAGTARPLVASAVAVAALSAAVAMSARHRGRSAPPPSP